MQAFVKQAAAIGVDVFRVFDSLNWVESMRVAMDAVIEASKVCDGTVCYTGDIPVPAGSSWGLRPPVRHRAREKKPRLTRQELDQLTGAFPQQSPA